MKRTFQTKYYEINSEKLSGQPMRFAFLTDLHGCLEKRLYKELVQAKPDLILIGGDMIVRGRVETYQKVKPFLKALAKQFPVYYALGNHEGTDQYREESLYKAYEQELTEAGVCFLHNETDTVTIKGCEICIHGLELPGDYYKKPFPPALTLETVQDLIGTPSEAGFHILLAHNPMYGKVYFDWGADLILCGHVHGGVLRFSENLGLISPQFRLFPKYGVGNYQEGKQRMLVGAGLGEHSIPLRIHNPRELLLIENRS